MTNHETRIMLLWGLMAALVLTAATQAQYWYAKSHHLLTGLRAVDDESQWLTEHIGWIITLFLGLVEGSFLYFVFWVALMLLGGSKSSVFKRKGRTKP